MVLHLNLTGTNYKSKQKRNPIFTREIILLILTGCSHTIVTLGLSNNHQKWILGAKATIEYFDKGEQSLLHFWGKIMSFWKYYGRFRNYGRFPSIRLLKFRPMKLFTRNVCSSKTLDALTHRMVSKCCCRQLWKLFPFCMFFFVNPYSFRYF